jgi:hypothetical protein
MQNTNLKWENPTPSQLKGQTPSKQNTNFEEPEEIRSKGREKDQQKQALAIPISTHQTSSKFKSLRPPSPIVEPMVLNPTEENPYKTHVQQATIDTDHGLYDNPDKPFRNEPIQVIYDTGASTSMLPAEYTLPWANLRECLHTLTGCFSGHTEKNLMIGEFHGILNTYPGLRGNS